MGNILSQDEVDSLLGGINEGDVQTETDTPEKEQDVKIYDFTRPAGPIHQRMPALGIINERLVGLLRTDLQTASRSVIDVNLTSTESFKFKEFCRSIPVPTSLNIFSMEPLRGLALLVLEGPLVFSFVDSLFGGKGVSHVKLEGRGFTKIEVKIVEKIVKIILKDMQQAWADAYKIKTELVRSEMDPQFAGIVTSEDMVVTFKYEVQLENGSGLITICIPYSMIEPIKKNLENKVRGEKVEVDHTWKKYIEHRLLETDVEVSCIMGIAKINGGALINMKVDDVILLDQKMKDLAVINVEGIPKYWGRPGECGNKKAVKIIERIK